MNWKKNLSAELMTGTGLVVVGVLATLAGFHQTMVQALAPFGVGLILTDALGRFGRTVRQAVRIRRDE